MPSSDALHLQNSREYCDLGGQLTVVGQPLAFGPTDMAVGVHPHLPRMLNTREVSSLNE